MALPRLERAVRAIRAQLETSTLEGGYYTDAGAKTFRARRSLDPQDLPCAVVWVLSESTDTGAGGNGSMKMTADIGVDFHVKAEQADTGELLELAKADGKRCLLAWDSAGGVRDADGQLGALVYLGATAGPREEGMRSEYVRLNFSLAYRESRRDPSREGARE